MRASRSTATTARPWTRSTRPRSAPRGRALGGVLGSAASGVLLRRLSPPTLLLGSVWYWAAVVALLLTLAIAILSSFSLALRRPPALAAVGP